MLVAGVAVGGRVALAADGLAIMYARFKSEYHIYIYILIYEIRDVSRDGVRLYT